MHQRLEVRVGTIRRSEEMREGMREEMLHTSQPQAIRRQYTHEVTNIPFVRAAANYSHHRVVYVYKALTREVCVVI